MSDTRTIARDLLACALAWEPGVRLLGNVTAEDIAALCRERIAEARHPMSDDEQLREAVMSAPRVPANWTREAADAVWAEYQRSHVLCATDDVDKAVAWDTVPGACSELNGGFEEPSWTLRWASEAARLRAWAAVGAPVLAPAEDGKASLAEWVAATGTDDCIPDEYGLAFYHSSGVVVRIELMGAGFSVSLNGGLQFVATPAELRALLDGIAERSAS